MLAFAAQAKGQLMEYHTNEDAEVMAVVAQYVSFVRSDTIHPYIYTHGKLTDSLSSPSGVPSVSPQASPPDSLSLQLGRADKALDAKMICNCHMLKWFVTVICNS